MLASLVVLLASVALALTPARPARGAPEPASTAAVDSWETTIERVVPSVVAIRVTSPRAFDTEGASTSVATGFVVDAERGILLTNRHVVEPGPVVAEAVFQNNEEVPLQALYRDPVHDFGFYRFDPAALRFMKATALPLEPGHAKVGVELRVVGNDAGEKISILQGTLARLDRDAPSYGEGRYNDFDTFYYQAASSTSGGSSGSPVLDVHGHVIALNAGGSNRAASSFYLPLDRVVRALDLVRAGQPVTRGTIQTVFRYRTYDEVRRLGVRDATEAAARAAFPEGTGMLVVDQVVPGGPAAGKLEPGDVIVRVEGELLAAFVPWEARVDGLVGKSVTIEVERGGQPLTVTLPVQDLHAITPSTFLEIGGGVLNPFSFQQARSHVLPVETGVWVASAGYMLGTGGIPEGGLIVGVGQDETRTLAAVEAAFSRRAPGERVPVRWIDPREPRREQVAVVTVDREWFPMQRCTRDDATGSWPCVASAAPPPARPVEPATGTLPEVDGRIAKALAPSLVWVTNTIPYRAEGVYAGNFSGTGVVIDAERGLVLVDRDTVPIALGDVMLTFAGTVKVPGRVAWIHPLHGFAVVTYDPAAIGETPVRAVTLASKALERGAKTWHVGLSPQMEILQQETKATAPQPLLLTVPRPPFFRDRNLEVIGVERAAPVVGGVLADRAGRVQALWTSFVHDRGDKPTAFFSGVAADVLADVITPLREGGLPAVRSFGAELAPMNLAAARERGLPADWAQRLAEADPERRQVLWVVRREAGTPAAEVLREGDLVLAVGGDAVARVREIERAARAERVALTILRDGAVKTVDLATVPLDGDGVDRVLIWAGAVLHAPHPPLAVDYGVRPEGVYVSAAANGSPSVRYGLRATLRILAVDEKPTPTLDAFLAAVAGRADRASVRLRTVDLDGKTQVITMKLDLRYWPTSELARGAEGWRRTER